MKLPVTSHPGWYGQSRSERLSIISRLYTTGYDDAITTWRFALRAAAHRELGRLECKLVGVAQFSGLFNTLALLPDLMIKDVAQQELEIKEPWKMKAWIDGSTSWIGGGFPIVCPQMPVSTMRFVLTHGTHGSWSATETRRIPL